MGSSSVSRCSRAIADVGNLRGREASIGFAATARVERY
jgi:hypothetical protein